VAVALVALAFPLMTLLHQQSEIDATQSAIAQLHQLSQNLTAQAKVNSSASAAIALAREDYQMVLPGQALIQVLPGRSTSFVSENSGDPGLQPLVSPQGADLVTTPTATSSSNGFLTRFVHTLEFWR